MDADLKPVLHGIQFVLEEIRELRLQSLAQGKQAAEDRKEAAEDRKQAAERFDRYVRESTHREKDLGRALAVIGKFGKDIFQTQQQHTRILEQILRAIRAQGNGRHGNGRARS